jgi:hypothetical protein
MNPCMSLPSYPEGIPFQPDSRPSLFCQAAPLLALLFGTSKQGLHVMSFTLAVKYGKILGLQLWLAANILAQKLYA